MKLWYLIVLCMIGWIYPACAETPLPIDDPDALSEAIKHSDYNDHGLNKVAMQLTQGFGGPSSAYETVIAHIETGDKKWLKVADTLQNCLGCIDAGTAEELTLALRVAFIHAPEVILRRNDIDSLKYICGVPLYEPTKVEYDNYVKSLKAAVKRVKDPALQDKKAECSKLIDAVHWVDQSK